MIFKTIVLFVSLLTLSGFCFGTPPPDGDIRYLDTPTESNNNNLAISPSIPNQTTPDQLEFPHLNLPATPDWDGLLHDSKLFMLYQVGVVGVLYLMPQSVSQWGDDQKRGNIFRKWDDNVHNLRKDKDNWEVNYIGHPYFGSVYYVRARQRGFDRQGALLYGTVMSTIYEYGIEALFEPASIQDLIFTPVGGAVVGEYFMIARENILRGINQRGYATTGDNIKLFFTDPLGVINKRVDKAFGYKEASIEIVPLLSRTHDDNHSLPTLVGLQAHLSW